MLARDIMQPHPVSATPETRLPHLIRVLQRRGFRHLPVVAAGKLVGILSDRDLKQAVASAAAATEGREGARILDRLTAAEIMARSVVTISPTSGVDEAARLMATRKISALPVTEEGRLIGIVTETDVLGFFVRAMGVLEPSSRLNVVVGDEACPVGTVVRVVEETGIGVSSVMTLETSTGERELMLRLATIDPGPAVRALEARGYAVRTPRAPGPHD